jgi:quercetin dioxygenase-like cupin family protein
MEPAVTRRSLLAGAGSLVLIATASSSLAEPPPLADTTRRKKTMDIKRSGSRPSSKGPDAWFTGNVRVDPLFQAGEPARVSGGHVTFEPGARTMWHTHPLGQTIIITSGVGRVQCEGGPVEEVHPGDIVWFPPKEKHWHGATATTAMTHIAVTEWLDGKNVDWMEQVTDAQYAG